MPILDLNPPDELAAFETALRTTGTWARAWGDFSHRHFMLARNPKSNLAISRCGQIILPFAKLAQDTTACKCFVCALYENSGKEVNNRLERTLTALVSKYE